jgi:hypothetical protein
MNSTLSDEEDIPLPSMPNLIVARTFFRVESHSVCHIRLYRNE